MSTCQLIVANKPKFCKNLPLWKHITIG